MALTLHLPLHHQRLQRKSVRREEAEPLDERSALDRIYARIDEDLAER